MIRYISIIIDILASYGFLVIYMPICTTLFSILPLNTGQKFFIVPIIEETLRFSSILVGGLVQYLFTLMFAINEYTHVIIYVKSKYGMIPDGFEFYRVICIFAHIGLLYFQLKMFRKYQRTKRYYYLFVGFFGAVTFHELYNYHIGKVLLKVCMYLF